MAYTKRRETMALFTHAEVEEVARPLLLALRRVSADLIPGGFESVFLSRVDTDARGIPKYQEVVCAENSEGGFTVPEGTWVDWADSGCRVLYDLAGQDHGPRWVCDFKDRFAGEFPAGERYDLQTYMVLSIRDTDGHLMGTLCAGSAHSIPQHDTLIYAGSQIVRSVRRSITDLIALRVLGGGLRWQPTTMVNPESVVP